MSLAMAYLLCHLLLLLLLLSWVPRQELSLWTWALFARSAGLDMPLSALLQGSTDSKCSHFPLRPPKGLASENTRQVDLVLVVVVVVYFWSV